VGEGGGGGRGSTNTQKKQVFRREELKDEDGKGKGGRYFGPWQGLGPLDDAHLGQ